MSERRKYSKTYLIHLYEELIENFCYDWRGGKLEDSNNCDIEFLLWNIEACKYYVNKRRNSYYKRKQSK